ncbi:hypothetical protein [Natronogracilivirga saccharolytica]|nr:hypothetical protein [Natronogracilivirga saccharolytica]
MEGAGNRDDADNWRTGIVMKILSQFVMKSRTRWKRGGELTGKKKAGC